MATNTLPPGWTGNDRQQTCDVGPFRLHAFGGGTWGVSMPAAGPAWFVDGCEWSGAMPGARAAAVAGLRAVLTAVLADSTLTLTPTEP